MSRHRAEDSKMDLVRIRIDVVNMHVTSQSRRLKNGHGPY